jgi:hypothetical protein
MPTGAFRDLSATVPSLNDEDKTYVGKEVRAWGGWTNAGIVLPGRQFRHSSEQLRNSFVGLQVEWYFLLLLFLQFSLRIQHYKGKSSIWVWEPRLFGKPVFSLTTFEVEGIVFIDVFRRLFLSLRHMTRG